MEIIPRAPQNFDGTLDEFYETWEKKVLIPVEAVQDFHQQFYAYLQSENPIFHPRQVLKQERGKLYTTCSGERMCPTDNAPAWWIHYQLFTGEYKAFTSFNTLIEAIPCKMFAIKLPDNINHARWHVAHIFAAKDRNVDFIHWDRKELVSRMARSIHPCNYFYLPLIHWETNGADKSVQTFFYNKFKTLYACIWDEFMELIDANA